MCTVVYKASQVVQKQLMMVKRIHDGDEKLYAQQILKTTAHKQLPFPRRQTTLYRQYTGGYRQCV